MDEFDRRLVEELGYGNYRRIPFLAAKLGVDKSTLHRRIRNLRKKGIISIIAVPNPVRLGYRAWADIGIKVQHRSPEDVAHELARHPATYFIFTSFGMFDVGVGVQFRTFERLLYYVNSELTKIDGIAKIETMPYICPRKYYNFSWPALSFRNDGSLQQLAEATADIYQLDEMDLRILSILSQDGLVRPATLKTMLGIGESTIRKRIKNMINQDFFRTEVIPNPSMLPYEIWAGLGITVSRWTASDVIDTLLQRQEVYFASESLGRFNVVIFARFRKMECFNQFVSMELPAIEGIASVEPFLINKAFKYHGIISDSHPAVGG